MGKKAKILIALLLVFKILLHAATPHEHHYMSPFHYCKDFGALEMDNFSPTHDISQFTVSDSFTPIIFIPEVEISVEPEDRYVIHSLTDILPVYFYQNRHIPTSPTRGSPVA